MRFFPALTLTLALLLAPVASQAGPGEVAFLRVAEGITTLPPCPVGCEVRFYPGVMPLLDATRKEQWLEFFSSNGVHFTKGGFILYHQRAGCFVMAATAEEHDAIMPSTCN